MTDPSTTLATTTPGVLAAPGQLFDFTEAWLANRRLSDHTRDAYRRDVHEFLCWCDGRDLAPLSARFTHLNEFGRHIESAPRRGGRAASARTIARKLSAVSSWYKFLVRIGAVPANPMDGVDRPAVDKGHTTTVSFTAAEAGSMQVAIRGDRYLGHRCAAALLGFLVDIGARVSEVCAVDIADLGYDSGHRTVTLTKMKGGKQRTRAVPPELGVALDAYLGERADRVGAPVDQLAGALFVTASGDRIDRYEVYRFVRRAARAAGLPAANRITPHSFRHAWNATAREAGASLEVRQDSMGHADSRTTQGYDRDRWRLAADPSYLVAAAVAAASR